MNKFLAGLAGLAVLTLAAAARAGESPVAVIDLEKLIRCHPNTKADKKLLEQTLKEYGAEKEQARKRAEECRKEFEEARKAALNPALSENARRKLEEEADAKLAAAREAEREYGETVRVLQRQLTDQEMRMLTRTKNEIEEAVAAHAKETGLALVLHLPARKLGAASGVIYASPAIDITEAIMRRMKIEPEADAPAAEGAPAQTEDVPPAPAG